MTENNGRRGGTRTPDPRIRNPLLYPPELHALKPVQLDDIGGFGRSQMAGPAAVRRGFNKRATLEGGAASY